MNPHGDKHLPPAASNHIPSGEPEPSRLLDLPAEIRLMIYGYALGCHNSRWRLAFDFRGRYVLELCDTRDADYHCPISLLQTCKSISHESLPILYNQTHFDILFCAHPKVVGDSGYLLQFPNLVYRSDLDLTSLFLQRIKHLRSFLLTDKVRSYMGFSLTSILGLHMVGKLKSLRLVFNNLGCLSIFADAHYTARMLRFLSSHGNASLEFLAEDRTEESITCFKQSLNRNVPRPSLTDEC